MNDSEEKKEKTKKKTTSKKTTNRINKKKLNNSKKKKNVNHDKNNKDEKSATTFNLIEVIIIMIITAVFGILIGSCATYFKEKVIDNDIPSSFDEFLDVYEELIDNYYEDIDGEELIEAGIEGMVDYLEDVNSSYLDSSATAELNETLEGEFVGMGATVTINESGYTYVVSVFDDSPAEEAGIQTGDIIMAVDGVDVTYMSTDEISSLIKGEKGTSVVLTIYRDGVQQDVEVIRDTITLSSVSYYVTENNKIGYIGVSVFAKNTPEQFEEAMDELISNGVTSVIIDVRDNNGGYLSSAEEIANMFLNDGDIVYQLDTKGDIEKIKSSGNKKYDVTVAVLINESSASASEVLAAALNENLSSSLIGKTSYGKGTVQKTITLSSGAMVKYTAQEWYTPNGNKVDGVGLTPTYEVDFDDSGNDTQLQMAISILETENNSL